MQLKITKKQKLFSWFKDIQEKIKRRKIDSLNLKIEALRKSAYRYYLGIHIQDVQKNNKVDFPEFEYLSGRITCPFAQIKADEEIEKIKKQGPEKINKCYSILLKNIRKEARKNKRGY
jgi:hypothetical protein